MLDLSMLAALQAKYPETAGVAVADFALGAQRFDFERSKYLMGVVNLSADSWYRESVCLSTEAAVRRGRVLHEQGAAIIDVGAESSLAQAARVGGVAQKDRLLPVVRELAAAGVCVSVETYEAEVALACLQAGAQVINLTGTVDNARIYREVANREAGVIICFVPGANVREAGELELVRDPVGAMSEFFARRVGEATEAGVTRIWLDPGLGFYYQNLPDGAARVRHQMQVFLNSFRLRTLGWPICQALPHAFECFGEEVRSAEPFFAVPALLGGTDLLRTHEVARVQGVLRTMELIRGEDVLGSGTADSA